MGLSLAIMGERRLLAGCETACCQIRAGGRINSGGSPFILEPPPEYIGAVGRNRILFLHGNNLTACLSHYES